MEKRGSKANEQQAEKIITSFDPRAFKEEQSAGHHALEYASCHERNQ